MSNENKIGLFLNKFKLVKRVDYFIFIQYNETCR